MPYYGCYSKVTRPSAAVLGRQNAMSWSKDPDLMRCSAACRSGFQENPENQSDISREPMRHFQRTNATFPKNHYDIYLIGTFCVHDRLGCHHGATRRRVSQAAAKSSSTKIRTTTREGRTFSVGHRLAIVVATGSGCLCEANTRMQYAPSLATAAPYCLLGLLEQCIMPRSLTILY